MIRLRIVDAHPEEPEAGDIWRYLPGDRDGRACWWIELPQTHPDLGTPGHPSRISWRTTDLAADGSGMWEVAGDPEHLTVTPSIDVERWVKGPDDKMVRDGSYWHGHIRDGVLDPA